MTFVLKLMIKLNHSPCFLRDVEDRQRQWTERRAVQDQAPTVFSGRPRSAAGQAQVGAHLSGQQGWRAGRQSNPVLLQGSRCKAEASTKAQSDLSAFLPVLTN